LRYVPFDLLRLEDALRTVFEVERFELVFPVPCGRDDVRPDCVLDGFRFTRTPSCRASLSPIAMA
jgi:hypothetical protein